MGRSLVLPVRAIRGFGLAAAVLVASVSSADAPPWSVLVLIYPNTEVTYGSPPKTFSGSMPDVAHVEDVVVNDFPALVSQWSSGVASVHVEKQIITQEKITQVSSYCDNPDSPGPSYGVAPSDLPKKAVDLIAKGNYDSVVLIWYAGVAGETNAIPVEYDGCSSPGIDTIAGKTITYSTVPFHANPGVLNDNPPAEAIVHEWLHGVCPYYQGLGYVIPGQCSDDGSDCGYSQHPGPHGTGGWSDFYRDFMSGKILPGRCKDGPVDTYSGISEAVWNSGTLRSIAIPPPPQLLSPVAGLCAGATPTLRWAAGSGSSNLFKVLLYQEDDPVNPIGSPEVVSGTAWMIPSGRLVGGKRYFWRVRSASQPPGAVESVDADILDFRSSGELPAPQFTPDQPWLATAGQRISISDPGVNIYYTTDGSDPTISDRVGTSLVTLPPYSPPLVLKARAWPPVGAVGCAPSAITSVSYQGPPGLLVTNTGTSGAGSLREAILEANAHPGMDEITFSIPGGGVHTISPTFTSFLPEITDPVIISGESQPGYQGVPLIEIDGTNAGAQTVALAITAGGSTVSALAINHYSGSAIHLEGPGGNNVEGCYLGVSPLTGMAAPNGTGVTIVNSPKNWVNGIFARNLLSGNSGYAIVISGGGAFGNWIVGNYIGTDASGNSSIANSLGGLLILGAPFNHIGSSALNGGNLISGNGAPGATANGDGIAISDALSIGNVLQGNRIGTNASGSARLANARYGVSVSASGGFPTCAGSAARNTIGGTEAGAGNLISGNGSAGIALVSCNGGGDGNQVLGNYIGTDVSGEIALGNAGAGVLISPGAPSTETAPSSNVIGGRVEAARNLISGNGTDGVTIIGGSTSGNHIEGNYIGTDVQGIFALANTRSGVRLTSDPALPHGASNNVVGGTSYATRNVISGNGQNGVAIVGIPGGFDGDGSTANEIRGNLIGLGAEQGALGNGVDGILVTTNILGGRAALNLISGNVIGHNGQSGIKLDGSGVSEILVDGNLIGVDASGAAHGNSGAGIWANAAPLNTIGGAPGNVIGISGNTIAMNAGSGVKISSADRDEVSGNSIFQNGGLGIDPSSANNGQAAPVLGQATTGIETAVSGTLSGASGVAYRLEIFSNTECDPSGFGEGRTLVAVTSVTPGSTGSAAILAVLPEPVPVGQFVTATATDPAGNTSAFSNCLAAGAGTPQDPDGDTRPGIGGASDNCPFAPNPGQEDTGGIGSSTANGRGNACECGDVDPGQDGIVDATDVSAYRLHLVDPAGHPFLGAVAGKCSVTGSSSAICNLADVVVLRRALAGKGPGIAEVCSLATGS